ncbi:oxidoreductase [Corynebacterium sp. sy017]|uniref:CE1759 family FMN reductase n=1 Tax=unclassified Corynebacterium TaxID=2624378 RepID=UPI0011853114|nr:MULTISPECIES: CE1759 family FMN reductase [unclassified Corynebacterium]MBP3088382.1 oxidoreductase [Corynebacterium sp. sy017]TSD92082.1 oxidoreductase [Corynebacterium sp. SY003]
MKKLVVLSAGIGMPSTTRMLADRIVQAVEAEASHQNENLITHSIEIRDLAMDLAAIMSTGIPSDALTDEWEQIADADAIIAATPVFSASYSGLFKMFIDTLDTNALNGVPVIIAATAGTPRHSLVLDFALRPLFTFLRAVVVPTGIFAATQDFGSDGGLDQRIRRAAVELVSEFLGRDVGKSSHGDETQDERKNIYPARYSATRIGDNVPSFQELLKGHEG